MPSPSDLPPKDNYTVFPVCQLAQSRESEKDTVATRTKSVAVWSDHRGLKTAAAGKLSTSAIAVIAFIEDTRRRSACLVSTNVKWRE